MFACALVWQLFTIFNDLALSKEGIAEPEAHVTYLDLSETLHTIGIESVPGQTYFRFYDLGIAGTSYFPSDAPNF